ncbi:hypothetical protein LTR05_006030 [Lithohypha guttulata]|uniref:Uncharacterized protein n=1 Tax=Lithohypha guttulata TaxID=1690604 RepID=A0AAN7SWH8_9EURO|nr:hypothetical protein LTR05_006030 [Lithohypha guttulata]
MAADKKVVLITGCSDGGLGSALALSFHKTGHRVIATARDLSKLSETRSAGIEELQLDVTSSESIAKCAESLTKITNGSLDLLINNAGGTDNSPMMDTELDQMRKLFDLNTFSLVSTTQAFLPLLLKTPNAKVINHISMAAYIGVPFQGGYNASKAAANALTETMRLELAPFDVQVIALMTGMVKSNILNNRATKKLPEKSIYNVLPGGLKAMYADGSHLWTKNTPDAHTWADQMVTKMSRVRCPYIIWGGESVNLLRLTTHMPVGTLDGTLRKISQLDEIEKAVKKR